MWSCGVSLKGTTSERRNVRFSTLSSHRTSNQTSAALSYYSAHPEAFKKRQDTYTDYYLQQQRTIVRSFVCQEWGGGGWGKIQQQQTSSFLKLSQDCEDPLGGIYFWKEGKCSRVFCSGHVVCCCPAKTNKHQQPSEKKKEEEENAKRIFKQLERGRTALEVTWRTI